MSEPVSTGAGRGQTAVSPLSLPSPPSPDLPVPHFPMTPLPPPVNYLIARNSELPPITASMFEYVLGANGLFLRLQREGFTATAPLAECPIRGLAPVAPHFRLHYPLVPTCLSLQMLQLSRHAAPQEILFHFYFQQGRWKLRIPRQKRRAESVLR
ncbi:hypothetical protein [Lusitaniella coriacea]|uniref:hypothetical protein n=1 Tax=Lusitaniella coriacea TaxID=1983105 RepID=UPI003CEB7624